MQADVGTARETWAANSRGYWKEHGESNATEGFVSRHLSRQPEWRCNVQQFSLRGAVARPSRNAERFSGVELVQHGLEEEN